MPPTLARHTDEHVTVPPPLAAIHVVKGDVRMNHQVPSVSYIFKLWVSITGEGSADRPNEPNYHIRRLAHGS